MTLLIGSIVLASAVLTSSIAAQVKTQGPEPALITLGTTSRIEIHIDTDQAPGAPKVPAVEGLRIEVAGPSYREHQTVVNGRLRVSRAYTYALILQPQRDGRFQIPEFSVPVGAKQQKVGPFSLQVVKDPSGEDHGFLNVTASKSRVYHNETLRLRVDYGVDMRLRLARLGTNAGSIYAVLLQAPWVDAIDGMERVALAEPQGNEALLLGINGQASVVRLQSNYKHEGRDGRDYHRFILDRAFLPTKPGRYELSGPVLHYVEQVTEDRTGMFFDVQRGRRKDYFIYGKPLTIEVLPLPEGGKPASFSGAVGQFEVSTSVGTHRVKVGSSVKLTFEVKGHGNLEFLELPKTLDLPGFHCLGRLEKRDAERAAAIYDLTPTKVDIKAIPPISFSYFDTTPGVEKYVTIATRPIELFVEALEGEAVLPALADSNVRDVTPGVDDIFDIKPLDDAPVRTGWQPDRPWGTLLAILVWVVALALTATWRRHRRRLADVVGQRARLAQRQFAQSVAAGGNQTEALVQYLADRLGCEPAAIIEPQLATRLRLAGMAEELAAEVQAAVEAGVAHRYGGTNDGDHDVRRLVQRIEGETLQHRVSASMPASIMALALLLGTQAQAQTPARDAVLAQDPAAEAVAAYRSGDYGKARQRFSALADAGDRRAAYNLGNTLFRSGRYAEALAAYERARLAMPRDADLWANIRLCRQHLNLQADHESFLASLLHLRELLTAGERFWLCILLNGAAALLLFGGGRRLRWAGIVLVIPALVLGIETWIGPRLPPKGIVLGDKTAVRSEPTDRVEALATLSAGLAVRVVSMGEAWCLVRVDDRVGYVESQRLAVID